MNGINIVPGDIFRICDTNCSIYQKSMPGGKTYVGQKWKKTDELPMKFRRRREKEYKLRTKPCIGYFMNHESIKENVLGTKHDTGLINDNSLLQVPILKTRVCTFSAMLNRMVSFNRTNQLELLIFWISR